MNVGNCPRCGKLYVLNMLEACPSCLKEVEQQYYECVEYLRKEKGANIQQLSDDTGVSIKQITKFIKEGRISVKDAPNLTYPCEVCGTFIREGHMCDGCRARLTKELAGATQEVSQGEASGLGSGAYNAIDKFKRS
ncbi:MULTISPECIES: TIGR03826 family flagellar region protein [unclassified Paenibacillus]|uniref:TIGR03826 family flagellar region protein n=1 Tax=Paenibacillus provencensis TaxID=441151 RepID=A0ABW3PU62_9BACL|nr:MULTISPECIES: TIGR03826 family flagellar region protein [unclassified Paenibacillus]MCM3128297.1 flagellar protein [Paenibacillus sp. MER 78]SFS85373.1 flagellar operon protein TIGR03826 [Paenibacillus sp. 453mf]